MTKRTATSASTTDGFSDRFGLSGEGGSGPTANAPSAGRAGAVTKPRQKGDGPLDLLNDLFRRSAAYAETEAYLETIRFISEFRSQGPYNAYLLLRQNPSVSFTASAYQWEKKYGARLKPGARPLVILVPFGPVGFVYDIQEVDGNFPKDVLDPFPMTGALRGPVWANTLRNAEAHGVGVRFVPASQQHAGRVSKLAHTQAVPSALLLPEPQNLFGDAPARSSPATVTVQLLVELNDRLEPGQRYLTLVHELAHVACGHLGRTYRADGRAHPWPDRQCQPREAAELEAESVAYLVGRRAGVEARSEAYLAHYVEALNRGGHAQQFSFEVVLSAANRLESWGLRPPRKAKSGAS